MSDIPVKHTCYFQVIEALKRSPGCGICQLAEQTGRRFLEVLLSEHVNDPETRGRLRQSPGLCRRHACSLLAFQDALGVAILYQDQVTVELGWLENRLQNRQRRRWLSKKTVEKQAPCLACSYELAATRRYLQTVGQFAGDAKMMDALEQSGGFCFPHLRMLVDECGVGGRIKIILEFHREKIQSLREQLDLFIQKSDNGHIHEPFGPERDAWRRAVAALHGSLGS